MFTSTSPSRAVANWVTSHSTRLGDQIPTRSPLSSPSVCRPAASASTASQNSRQFQRTPCSRKATASRSGKRATVCASNSGTVCSDSGMLVSPLTCESPPIGRMVGEDSACIVILVSKARLWFVTLDVCECYSINSVSIGSGVASPGFPGYLRCSCLILAIPSRFA
ncbi:hypothetical protein D9M68_397840 [compost metagenome]